MDTSKEYIKMCDCPEIQNSWKPISSDLFYCREPHNKVNVVFKSIKNSPYDVYFLKTDTRYEFYSDRVIWLPRQDQLQKIIKLTEDKTVDLWLLDAFNKFVQNYWEKFDSMGQLWLAFVMREKFNKVWKDEEWR